jgi:hypothetical protein
MPISGPLFLDIGVEFLLNSSRSIDFSKISPLRQPRFLVATVMPLQVPYEAAQPLEKRQLLRVFQSN